MNKWSQIYLEKVLKGKKPHTRSDKEALCLLDKVGKKVSVFFPDLESPIPSQNRKAHVDTYVVDPEVCNMPEGIISVELLACNLPFWKGRGYRVETDGVEI